MLCDCVCCFSLIVQVVPKQSKGAQNKRIRFINLTTKLGLCFQRFQKRGLGLSHYKTGLIFTTVLLVFVLGVLFSTYMKTGDFVERGIDFKGGTEIVVTLTPGSAVDLQKIQDAASKAVSGDITVKETTGTTTMLIFQSDAAITKENIIAVLNSEGVSYDSGGISSQAVGASLGTAFWSQAKMAIVAAFLVMASLFFTCSKTPCRQQQLLPQAFRTFCLLLQ